ncbi:MAG: DUF1549 domain-containing protein [Pirellulaceae bacterium]
MKWYQSLFRWALLGCVAMVGIGFLAGGLLGDAGKNAELPVYSPPGDDVDWMQVVHDVDKEFQTAWSRDAIQNAELADWRTVCRRLSLALVGNGISLEDMRWLESLPEGTRIRSWTERLLADRRFADYWAERLARSYVGADEGPFIVYRRRRFVNWLSEQLYQNRPYSEIVYALITAQGIWTENPQVNFLTVTLDSDDSGRPDPIRLAARTSRAFWECESTACSVTATFWVTSVWEALPNYEKERSKISISWPRSTVRRRIRLLESATTRRRMNTSIFMKMKRKSCSRRFLFWRSC